MTQQSPRRFWAALAIAPLPFVLNGRSLLAQIVPDATLPNDSIVAPDGDTFAIEGGTAAGTNLFHSFSEFSVPAGVEAFFNNSHGIENIVARVTGNGISNIDGTLGANGLANLFLLNPNGIVFGPNARLDIGGSFVGSTAESLQFADGLELSATGEAIRGSHLLSIDVPIGLQFGPNSGAIAVRGNGISDSVPTDNFGLTVAPGQTFALAGSDIGFSGGIVTAPSGRIEIGSVRNGEVAIARTPAGLQLNYDGVTEFGNIELADRSSLFSPTIFDNPNGAIAVAGRSIVLDNSQIVSLTDGSARGGNIAVFATESLELGGLTFIFPFSSWISTQVGANATGNGGELRVSASQLSINDGARIQSLSFGAGAAGNVTVEASESIQIAGFALPLGLDLNPDAIDLTAVLEQSTHSRISSENFAAGAGGNLTVSAGELTLLEGGQITTLAGSQAIANGGNVRVAAEVLAAENAVPFNPLVPSGISSYTLGAAKGGEIVASVRQLRLSDGATVGSLAGGSGAGGAVAAEASESIAARGVNSLSPVSPSGILSIALGAGAGGSVRVSTQNLTLSEGAGIVSFASIELLEGLLSEPGEGPAGDIAVSAEAIALMGVNPENPENATVINSTTFGPGRAGNVSISTGRLTLEGGAAVSSVTTTSLSSLGEPLPGSGTGMGGDLAIAAFDRIEIVGANPSISGANSFAGTLAFGSGDAGNVVASTPNLILRDGGTLSTATASGGNAGTLVVSAENILAIDGGLLTANAFTPLSESFQQAFFSASGSHRRHRRTGGSHLSPRASRWWLRGREPPGRRKCGRGADSRDRDPAGVRRDCSEYELRPGR